MSKDFILQGEGIAKQLDGNDPATDKPMELGPDVLLYWRFGAFEQGVLNRLAISDYTLADEIEDIPGTIALGNPEHLRDYIHDMVDKMFATIYAKRKIISEEELKAVMEEPTKLDDILMTEEKHEESQETK